MNKGFSTLLIVIILGSIALTLSLAYSSYGIFVLRSGLNFENSARARSVANGCAELLLKKIKIDNFYSDSGTLPIDSYECGYEIINQGGNSRLINISADVNNVIRGLRIEIDDFNPLSISFWQEI